MWLQFHIGTRSTSEADVPYSDDWGKLGAIRARFFNSRSNSERTLYCSLHIISALDGTKPEPASFSILRASTPLHALASRLVSLEGIDR
ncbi:hypothetical protein NL676_035738 [Syzygium grande]|nr:hypothetical protein NL676_035738 [Syzygium grande]